MAVKQLECAGRWWHTPFFFLFGKPKRKKERRRDTISVQCLGAKTKVNNPCCAPYVAENELGPPSPLTDLPLNV